MCARMSALRNGKRATVSSNSQIWSMTQAPSSHTAKSTTAHLQIRTILGTPVVYNISMRQYFGTIFFYQHSRYPEVYNVPPPHTVTYYLFINTRLCIIYFCERSILSVKMSGMYASRASIIITVVICFLIVT